MLNIELCNLTFTDFLETRVCVCFFVCVCVCVPGDDPSAAGAAQSSGATGDGGSSEREVQ